MFSFIQSTGLLTTLDSNTKKQTEIKTSSHIKLDTEQTLPSSLVKYSFIHKHRINIHTLELPSPRALWVIARIIDKTLTCRLTNLNR